VVSASQDTHTALVQGINGSLFHLRIKKERRKERKKERRKEGKKERRKERKKLPRYPNSGSIDASICRSTTRRRRY
jgi:hypothetical protein